MPFSRSDLLGWTSDAEAVFDRAIALATANGDGWVTPQHLFLALSPRGGAAELVAEEGYQLEDLQEAFKQTGMRKHRPGSSPQLSPMFIRVCKRASNARLPHFGGSFKRVTERDLFMSLSAVASPVAYYLDTLDLRKRPGRSRYGKTSGRLSNGDAIDLYIDAGDASKETIQAVLDAITNLHIAAGGFGIEFIEDDTFLQITEGVEQ
ncbi:hypothetical protein [Lacipirellula sp.]|uniref:hypothetical protein n=1 Tax=Lacipirellula sp. TaxID=2691419 RepID=UPI003D099E9E